MIILLPARIIVAVMAQITVPAFPSDVNVPSDSVIDILGFLSLTETLDHLVG